MPKKPTDYAKSLIYKIQHNENFDLLYVGSTTDFHKRKHRHKTNSIAGPYKLYKTIRENGGWECFRMIIVKMYPCNSKVELLLEEDKIMQEYRASLNQLKASGIDWDHRNEQRKIYAEENREYFSELAKAKAECECGCVLRKGDLNRHKKTQKHIDFMKSK